MKLDELMKKYGLLLDEKGRYYRINGKGKREEPIVTITAIEKIFGISYNAIATRIKQANLMPVNMRNQSGRLCDGYNLNQLCAVCGDLLFAAILTDEQGMAVVDGRQFACLKTLSKILGVARETVKKRLAENKITSLSAKSRINCILKIYDVDRVKHCCSDLLKELPAVDANGIAQIEDQQFASIKKSSDILSLSETTIKSRVRKLKLIPVLVRNKNGNAIEAYNLAILKKSCSLLLGNLPVSDNNGIIKIAGKEHATLNQLGIILGISADTIFCRIKKTHLAEIPAKDQSRRLVNVYDLEKVQSACADILADLPILNLQGFVVINGCKYASILKIAELLRLTARTVRLRIKKAKLSPLLAKNRNNLTTKVFNLDQVVEVCKDLLPKT